MKQNQFVRKLAVVILLFAIMFMVPTVSVSAASISYATDVVSSGLNTAVNVVEGPDDKLYIAEYGGNKVVKVDKNGQNQTTVVTGLNQPIGMVFDNTGNLYIAEHGGGKINRIDPGGTKTPIISGMNLFTSLVIDSHNKLYAVNYTSGKILKMDLDGSNIEDFAINLGTNSIIGMTVDADDNLYVSDRSGCKIRKIDPTGAVTDFIIGLNTPTWVTLGQDGYLYVSIGTKIIEKYDTSGNKVGSFQTPTNINFPWGTYIDQTGCIYFTTLGSGCGKIIGTAGTTSKTSIELLLNTRLSAGEADPTAFTVSGIASNPVVTAVATTGSSIQLNLSANIAYTDTNIKVNYAKTGTNNLTALGTAAELDNITNMPILNNSLGVVYNGNGNTGGAVPTDATGYNNGDSVTVLDNTGNLVKAGYTFAGWNTGANGIGTSYSSGNTFVIGSSSVTLHAQWRYAITLDTNGGNALTPSALTTGVDGKLTGLPVPTRSGYSFSGWFTAASDGTAVTTDTEFNANTNIYAQWRYLGDSGGSDGEDSPTPVFTAPNIVTGEVIDSKTGAAVKGINAQLSTAEDGTTVVQVKSQEAIIFKQHDGTQNSFSDVSKLGFTSLVNKDAIITMKTDGTIEISNLASNTQSQFAVYFDLGNNQRISIGTIEVKVGSNGQVTSLTSTLIDPYGTIIDATTGEKIIGAYVTLYYADTDRNKQNGNTANARVDLPILEDFKPSNNKNPQFSDQAGFYAFMVFPNADYYLVATKEGYEDYKSMTISVEQEIVKWDFKMNKPLTGLQRLAGDNRVDTALAIAKANNTTKVQNVVLTTAKNYPDALAGSVLAYKLNAPILLVDSSQNGQKKIMNYLIANLDTSGTVYILGGTGAVDQKVEDQIAAAGFMKITRISGKDRSETALKIAEQLQVPTGRPIILVNEGSYADALSISSSAAAGDSPILLVGKDKISDAVRQKITEINPIKVYIVGGEGVISAQVADQVAEITGLTSSNIIRLGGENRYATSLAVAKHFSLSGQSVCLATGKNFPDALAGGVFAANYNAPILLVGDTIGNEIINYLKTRQMVGGVIFGGEGVLDKKIEQELSSLIRK
ncbi:cell wall-binding repeat-containing protein [Desulfitobacterium sp. THU1]|uniref:cell wall-binding repeat-containing protein n=1 Tax=Desulfitobacterium sp. THU1 TaxID=3138072 RepID=UPI00311DCF52